MSKVHPYKYYPRQHNRKMDGEVRIGGIKNKIRGLDKTECLNLCITANKSNRAYYQIPVHVLQEARISELYVDPWKPQVVGATTLTNLQLKPTGKWNRFMTTKDIDPNKRVAFPSLEHLFPTDEPVSYKETSRAEWIRNRVLNPLEDLKDLDGDED